MRPKDFWKNFRYAIIILDETVLVDGTMCDGVAYIKYVTKIHQETKMFEMNDEEKIKELGLKIPTFPLDTAVELMNSMVCNGFKASITPYFD